MHKGFFRMVKKARKKGIYVATISNGSTLSNSVIRKICDAEVNYISISIDSVDSKEFSDNRIGGNVAQVLDGIKRLIAYRKENNLRYPKIGVRGTLIFPKENVVSSVVKKLKDIGVDAFDGFQPLNPKESYVSIYPKDKVNLLNFLDESQTIINKETSAVLADGNGGLLDVGSFFESENVNFIKPAKLNKIRKNCEERYIYSLLSGHVTPCCQIKEPINTSLNLFDKKLRDIYNDKEYENIKFNLWNGVFPMYCKGCYKTK